jgi:phage tail-like protein
MLYAATIGLLDTESVLGIVFVLLNALLVLGNVMGEARTIHQKFNFIIQIDGVDNAAFQDMSELSAEWTETQYYAGGAVIPDTQPARLNVAEVTLQWGATTGDGDIYNWWSESASAVTGGGTPSPYYKRNLDVVQLDKDGGELRRWTLYNAWIKKYVAGAWDNTSDDANLESITLRFDYFEKVFEASPQTAA